MINSANYKFPIKALFLLLFVLVTPVYASATSLPYLGPNLQNCQIVQPNSNHLKDIDGGYLTNEDCSIIFVKPPIIGELQNGQIEETQLSAFCGPTNAIIEAANQYWKVQTESEDNRKSLFERLKSAKDATEKKDIMQELADVSDLLNFSLEEIANIQTTLTNVNGNNNVSATLTGNLILNNSSLKEEYRKLNPGKTIMDLPITLGIIDGRVKPPPDFKNKDGLDIFQRVNVHPVISSQIGGLRISELINSDQNPNKRIQFPEYVGNLKGEPRLMGKTSNVILELNNLGYCASKGFLNADLSQGNTNSTLFTYIAPTYTYFYPVQSNAILKIEIDRDNLKTKLKQIYIESGAAALTSLKVYESMPDSAIKVIVNPGLFAGNEVSTELKNEYQEGLKKMILDEILARASVQIERLHNVSFEIKQETVLGKSCSRVKLTPFLPTIDFCKNYSYTVDVKVFNEEKFDKYLKSLVDQGGSAEVKKYMNYTMYDTSVFAPKSEK